MDGDLRLAVGAGLITDGVHILQVGAGADAYIFYPGASVGATGGGAVIQTRAEAALVLDLPRRTLVLRFYYTIETRGGEASVAPLLLETGRAHTRPILLLEHALQPAALTCRRSKSSPSTRPARQAPVLACEVVIRIFITRTAVSERAAACDCVVRTSRAWDVLISPFWTVMPDSTFIAFMRH